MCFLTIIITGKILVRSLATDCNNCDISSMERHIAAPISVKD